ncbi:GDSL-type esterase/lipase family protein [bacterium]|nr:GDSL-type esterase/lipase family protein [bacterium]
MLANRPVTSKLLLMAAGLSFVLILAEISLRVFNPVEFRVRGDRIILPTNKSYSFRNSLTDKLDSLITVRRNSLGFRGPEPPRQFDRFLSLITVGGSTTECVFLSEGESWTDIAGQELDCHCGIGPLWINNAGLDGHSTFGHLVLMQGYIVRLRPKVAVFLVGHNDIGRDDLSDFDLNQVVGIKKKSVKEFLLSLCNYSDFMALCYNGYLKYKARGRGIDHKIIDFKSLAHLEIDSTAIQAIKTRLGGEYLVNYGRRLERLVEICRANGIKPVFITQPVLYGEGIDPLTGVDLGTLVPDRRFFAATENGKADWAVVEMYNDVTRQVARQNGVLLIDLAHRLPKSSEYYYDYIHYSKAGGRAIGQIVAEELCPWLRENFPENVLNPDSASLSGASNRN